MSKIIVYHGGYGCETGCCGHYVKMIEEGVHDSSNGQFYFSHPSDDEPLGAIQFAKQLIKDEFGEDHIKDLDWDNCIISDD